MSLRTVCDRCQSMIDDDEVTRVYVYNASQLARSFFQYGPHEKKFDLCRKCWKAVSRTIERRGV